MWYYALMSKDAKIVRKMKQSPRSVRFSELEAFLRRQGFEGTQRGSHVQYRRADRVRFSIVNRMAARRPCMSRPSKTCWRDWSFEEER